MKRLTFVFIERKGTCKELKTCVVITCWKWNVKGVESFECQRVWHWEESVTEVIFKFLPI